jgi:nicotinamidase-related amidase
MLQSKKIKPALLIIDIQNSYLKYIPDKDKEGVLTMINLYIDMFRKHKLPVIRIYHLSEKDELKEGTEDFEFTKSVAIKSEDPKIIKTYPDSFNKTDLDKLLNDKRCNTLFLCGLSSVGCVLATLFGAINHNYKAFLVKDAMMSHKKDYTTNIEIMFDAVGYDMIQFILENAE